MFLFQSYVVVFLLLVSPTSATAAVVTTPATISPTFDLILSTVAPRARFLAQDSPTLAAAAKSFDAATTDIAKSVAAAAPALSPILTAGAVSYVAYVALNMMVPSTVRSIGLPTLDESPVGGRSFQSSGTFMERVTTQLFKDIFSKTEVAGTLMSTAGNIITSSVALIKGISRVLHRQIEGLRKRMDFFASAFSSGCFLRYLCQAGHMTSTNFPLIGFLLKSIRSHTSDEFAQALIDGATTGQCNSFKECL